MKACFADETTRDSVRDFSTRVGEDLYSDHNPHILQHLKFLGHVRIYLRKLLFSTLDSAPKNFQLKS